MWTIDSHVAWQVVGAEAVLMHLGSGQTIGLNETATFVWTRITTEPEEAIADSLAREYVVDVDSCRSDINELLGYLEQRKFIIGRL